MVARVSWNDQSPGGRMRRVIASALVMLAGCSVHRLSTVMDPWVGKPEADLVAKWGAPDRRADLAGGEAVLTWVKGRESALNPDGESASHRSCQVSVRVSAAHVIQSWSSVGCPKVVQS